ncbi:MAG: LytTR family DNA-binding domain-containing protein [Bacteroidia bacterium]|nr:LytTR family DNA-binding domain-containing protein [Bacteroidia bacterium]
MSTAVQAVLIDDVADARATLREELGEWCPQIEIIGEADGVVKGAKLIREKRPNLVFLDIQMADGSGFDLLEILGDAAEHFAVIFITGSDEFAIRAFRYAAIDYLLKPIDPDLLREAVAKAIASPRTQAAQVESLIRQVKHGELPTRLALHTMDKVYVVPISDIVRCESSANYTIFYLQDNRQLLVTRTLKEFDTILAERKFLRVHQSHLVNSAYIREFNKGDGGYLVMTDGTDVPVSSRKRATLLQQLGDL